MREPIDLLVRVEDTEDGFVRLVVNSVVIDEASAAMRDVIEQKASIIKNAILNYEGEPVV